MIATAKFLVRLSVPLLAVSVAACASCISGGPFDGRVVDAATQRPISGVTIVVRWVNDQSYSGTVCYHVEPTVTDSNGKFHIPKWSDPTDHRWPHNSRTEVIPYKPGFAYVLRPDGPIHLEPSTQTVAERLAEIQHISMLIGCYGAHNEKVLVPVYKTLYDEAKGLTSTEKDQRVLTGIKLKAFFAWRGPGRDVLPDELEHAIASDPYLREQFQ
jgi:hypothetical protein